MTSKKFSIRMTDKRLRTYLPRDLCDRCGIYPHSVLRMSAKDGCILIEPGIVRGVRDRSMAENLSYTKSCVRAMSAADLQELSEAVTARALELADTIRDKEGAVHGH